MVLGPGGVGTTSVAVAAAVSGTSGQRSIVGGAVADTLLVSLDPTPVIAATLGVYPVVGEPVQISSGVDLLVLDTTRLAAQAWGYLAPNVPAGTVGDLSAEEVTALPGVGEVLALQRIRDEATSGRYRRVVVDLSGAGDPVALLALPGALRGELAQIWPMHRRLALAGTSGHIAGAIAGLNSIDRDCADLQELFTSGDEVNVHLVLGAADARARLVLARLHAALTVLSIPVATVFTADETAVPAQLLGGAIEIWTVPRLSGSPAKIADFRKLGVELTLRTLDAVGPYAATVTSNGRALDDPELAYTYRWPQPLPDPESLTLGRAGDDLIVGLSGVRHRVTLPSVLQRCTVGEAQWGAGNLSVAFVPNPEVWPL